MPTISAPIHINHHSIDRVLNAGLPVVMAFWRPTDLSQQMNAGLEKLAAEYTGKILVALVNAQDESELAIQYRITATPSLVFVQAGQVVERSDGSLVEAVLRQWFDHLVKGTPRPAAPVRPAANPKGATNSSNGKPLTLTDANFAQTINGDQPVLVDFWAAWCGPCRMVAPAVEQLAQEFQGRAVVGKLNVDENQRTAQKYGIMSIPALLIFKNGRIVEQLVGVQPVGVLRQRLSRHTG